MSASVPGVPKTFKLEHYSLKYATVKGQYRYKFEACEYIVLGSIKQADLKDGVFVNTSTWLEWWDAWHLKISQNVLCSSHQN